ncbi:MAG: hypothetical protein JXB13_00975 [Phycisphaerae bacterium]|nr:hypothetical protein [Phycisphaerae bacterium]
MSDTGMPRWRYGVPDAVGYWLRVDSAGRLRAHRVCERHGQLWIVLEWMGDTHAVPVARIVPTMQGSLWYGPIPPPPQNASSGSAA